MAWAPAVGLLLGIIAAAVVLLLADHPLGTGPLTAAVLAVAALALLTRGLHLDGLADLADGLGSGKPASGALEIMRRSDIGPFGTVTLVLDAAHPGGGARATPNPPAMGAGRRADRRGGDRQAGARPGPAAGACRAARPDGLGALVAGIGPPGHSGRDHRWPRWPPRSRQWRSRRPSSASRSAGRSRSRSARAWRPAYVLQRHAVRRLGGITGDVLGALIETAATVTLVVAAMGPRA